jgi:hypothetical protein
VTLLAGALDEQEDPAELRARVVDSPVIQQDLDEEGAEERRRDVLAGGLVLGDPFADRRRIAEGPAAGWSADDDRWVDRKPVARSRARLRLRRARARARVRRRSRTTRRELVRVGRWYGLSIDSRVRETSAYPRRAQSMVSLNGAVNPSWSIDQGWSTGRTEKLRCQWRARQQPEFADRRPGSRRDSKERAAPSVTCPERRETGPRGVPPREKILGDRARAAGSPRMT